MAQKILELVWQQFLQGWLLQHYRWIPAAGFAVVVILFNYIRRMRAESHWRSLLKNMRRALANPLFYIPAILILSVSWGLYLYLNQPRSPILLARTFDDQKNGVRFRYPESFQIIPFGPGGGILDPSGKEVRPPKRFVVQLRDFDRTGTSKNVIWTLAYDRYGSRVPKIDPSKTWALITKRDIEKTEGARVTDWPLDIGGYKGHVLVYSQHVPRMRLNVTVGQAIVVVQRHLRIYYFSYIAPSDEWRRYEPVFDGMLGTVVFDRQNPNKESPVPRAYPTPEEAKRAGEDEIIRYVQEKRVRGKLVDLSLGAVVEKERSWKEIMEDPTHIILYGKQTAALGAGWSESIIEHYGWRAEKHGSEWLVSYSWRSKLTNPGEIEGYFWLFTSDRQVVPINGNKKLETKYRVRWDKVMKLGLYGDRSGYK